MKSEWASSLCGYTPLVKVCYGNENCIWALSIVHCANACNTTTLSLFTGRIHHICVCVLIGFSSAQFVCLRSFDGLQFERFVCVYCMINMYRLCFVQNCVFTIYATPAFHKRSIWPTTSSNQHYQYELKLWIRRRKCVCLCECIFCIWLGN